MPSSLSSRSVLSSSGDLAMSEAYTRAPARASSLAADRPLRANPTTAISPFSHSARSAGSDTGGMSAKLESAQSEEGAEDSHNPEPYNDLALLPTQLLEVVMQRRASKDAVLIGKRSAKPPRAILEHVPLQEDGQRFGDEH